MKLESIKDSYHYITNHCTDKKTYYGVKLSNEGFDAYLNLDADYIGDILAYSESFLQHRKELLTFDINKLEKELEHGIKNI